VRANTLVTLLIGVVALVAVVEILAFARYTVFRSERPPVETVQRGHRGTGMVQVYNPRTVAGLVEANQVPGSVPYAGDEGAKAGAVYENVRVLGDVSAGEFTRLMVNMTEWVAPAQGCAACHNVADFADDSLYPGFPGWVRSTRPKAPGILGQACVPPFTRRVRRDSTISSTVTA
jgi:hypothetical protein